MLMTISRRWVIWSFAALLPCLVASVATAKVQSQDLEYKVGDLTCKGYLAWDDSLEGPRPGVLVVHEWWGLNDYARSRANQLAGLGYIAFACDMYGEGRTVEHPQDAGKMATEVRMNVQEWRRRAAVALELLAKQPQCQPDKLAAIGYCFGGSTALQLAYSGADLDAVVTFHAALPTPTAEDARQIKAAVQVNHGAADGFISPDSIQQFQQGMEAGEADWSMTYYAGAVHGFTVKDAEARGVPGLKYNEHADQRSWQSMLDLFRERGLSPAK
ncbi:MAG: dienelactone hydrolase family protein [Planctomycetaceae bacterium]